MAGEMKKEKGTKLEGKMRGGGKEVKEDAGRGEKAAKSWGRRMHLPALMSHSSKSNIPPVHF